MSWRDVLYVELILYRWGIRYLYNTRLLVNKTFNSRAEAEAHAAAWFRQHTKEIDKILLSNE